MIRCAIAGLGRWGRALVEAASGNPGLMISRAVETDLESASAYCADRGIALTDDFDDVLDDPAIEVHALSAPIVLAGKSASGFLYFQTGFQPGSTLYLTGMTEASTGKEVLYFEIPLQ